MLCHRDYHSRNLMLHRDSLYIIDFQDARMGPDTYDLVSLLRDSYVDIVDREVDELIAYFLALKGRNQDDLEFRRRFDVMALQRNLKALGTFGYQTIARRNTVYIQYMPARSGTRAPTSRSIRASSGCGSCWRSRSRSCGRSTADRQSGAEFNWPQRHRTQRRRADGCVQGRARSVGPRREPPDWFGFVRVRSRAARGDARRRSAAL